jgi:hypothetical protein
MALMVLKALGIKIKQERWNAVADRLFNGLNGQARQGEQYRDRKVISRTTIIFSVRISYCLPATLFASTYISALPVKDCPSVC